MFVTDFIKIPSMNSILIQTDLVDAYFLRSVLLLSLICHQSSKSVFCQGFSVHFQFSVNFTSNYIRCAMWDKAATYLSYSFPTLLCPLTVGMTVGLDIAEMQKSGSLPSRAPHVFMAQCLHILINFILYIFVYSLYLSFFFDCLCISSLHDPQFANRCLISSVTAYSCSRTKQSVFSVVSGRSVASRYVFTSRHTSTFLAVSSSQRHSDLKIPSMSAQQAPASPYSYSGCCSFYIQQK